jgi:hypothetical protein
MNISESPIIIGRGSHCGLVVDDPSVSSSHAEISRRNGVVFVRDLNSTNGTRVDGTVISGESALRPGSVVQFGLVSYFLNGSELIESASNVGRTMIVGGAKRSSGDSTQQTPVIPPPPANKDQSQTSSNAGISVWLRGMLLGYVCLLGALVFAAVLIFVFFEQYISSNSATQEMSALNRWGDWEDIYNVIYVIAVLITLPIAVLLVIWSYQAHRWSDSLEPEGRRWGRGWSIGAWFIPLANIILAPLVLAEIHKIASVKRSNGRAETDWTRQPTPAVLILWFVFYALGTVILFFGNSVMDNEWSDLGEYRGGLIFILIGLGMTATASMLAAAFIKDISSKNRS